jgi:hypothetical protein
MALRFTSDRTGPLSGVVIDGYGQIVFRTPFAVRRGWTYELLYQPDTKASSLAVVQTDWRMVAGDLTMEQIEMN